MKRYIKGFSRIRGGVVTTPDMRPQPYMNTDLIENRFADVRNFIRNRLREGSLTDDKRNILTARYNYMADLGEVINEMNQTNPEFRSLIFDYLELLYAGTQIGDETLIREIPRIENWNADIGAEMIQQGLPVVNLMNLFG
jgi:hypothetical protein